MARTSGPRARAGAAAAEPDWPVTISVLAERVQMTPRNIRAHQTRGVLPPPVRRGRFACYDRRHEAVLLRIKELQDKGYSLAAIEEALKPAEGSALLQRLVLAPLLGRDEAILTWNEIAGMFNQRPDRDRYRRAVSAGLVTETGDGRLVAPSAALLRAARELIDLGVPFLELFDLQVEIAERNRGLAERFVRICLDRALAPYSDRVPPECWPEVATRFEELYGLMTSVLAASFAVGVRRAATSLLGEHERREETG